MWNGQFAVLCEAMAMLRPVFPFRMTAMWMCAWGPCPWRSATSKYNLSHLPIRKAHMVTQRAYLRSVCSPEPCCMDAQAAVRPAAARECVWIGPWARLNETQNVHRSQYLRPYATNRGDQGTSLQCSGKLPRCTGPHFCLLLDTAMCWAILDGGFPCPWGPAI